MKLAVPALALVLGALTFCAPKASPTAPVDPSKPCKDTEQVVPLKTTDDKVGLVFCVSDKGKVPDLKSKDGDPTQWVWRLALIVKLDDN